MSHCPSCGGVIGRDCWNPQECAEITERMAIEQSQPDPAPSNANTSGLYLLMKRGLYYRPDAMGYTGIKDHAGRYSKADAEGHADPASGVTMVSEAEAAEFSPNCFDDLARAHLLKQRDAAEARADRLAKALERIAYTPSGMAGLSLSDCISEARAALQQETQP